MAKRQEPLLEDDIDSFVPDSDVREEFDVSAMTLHRWDHDPDLGFPPAIHIRGRKYRSRKMLNEFKALQLKLALSNRKLIAIRAMNAIREETGVIKPRRSKTSTKPATQRVA